MRRYNQALVSQMSYTMAGDRLHSVEERMCRWPLMTRDRGGAARFPLTQEFLTQMLGVQRPSVCWRTPGTSRTREFRCPVRPLIQQVFDRLFSAFGAETSGHLLLARAIRS